MRENDGEYFIITRIHRDDISERLGIDASVIPDDVMEEIADRMADDYVEQLFWSQIDDIVPDILKYNGIEPEEIGEDVE